MGKKVTLQMIADRAGVSVVTVSNVLSGKKGASEEVRSNVLTLAQELGYRNEPPKRREKERAYRIGAIIAERYVREYPSFYMNIYKLITQKAVRKGCLVILEMVSGERERLEEHVSVFDSVDIDGILIIGEMNPEFVERVRTDRGLPVVGVDFYDVDKDMDFVITDSYRGMQLATQRLIDCGHRDIAFVGTPEATNSIMDRYMGYQKALMLNGISKSTLIYDREKSRYAVSVDFELPDELPSAFVCNCERSAYVLVGKLQSSGVRIPKDVSIAAFDRFQEDGMGGMEMTTYESDERAMAEISIATLLKRIEGNGKPAGIRMVEGIIHEGNTVKRRGE